MKRRISGKSFVLMACAAGLCAFAGTALAQESAGVSLPLDEAGAEAAALADAGVEETDAQRLRTVREREDGEDVIEVEFSCGDNSYEYIFRESDGMILEWSIEGRPVKEPVAELTLAGAAPSGETVSGTEEPQTEAGAVPEDTAGATLRSGAADEEAPARITADGTELVGYEQAMQIALADSGIAPEDAEFDKIKFEYDGRFYDYELELREGRAEYEYKIDAQTGEIVEVEHD